MKEILLVGAFSEIVELCEACNYKIRGIFDNNLTAGFMGYEILGTDQAAFDQSEKFNKIPVLVTPDDPKLRKKLILEYRKYGYPFISLISPGATISKYATIGNGAVIQTGVNVSANAVISDFVKLNTACNIMHDSVIGSYSTVAPNAVVLGRVQVGSMCYIGAGSTILPEKKIGDHSIVGAGAVVTRTFGDHVTVAGVPAKIFKSADRP
ncbi:MAG: NeuD/PglB/VioB family sugar acetyltransferase [Bacteroidota bacterium]